MNDFVYNFPSGLLGEDRELKKWRAKYNKAKEDIKDLKWDVKDLEVEIVELKRELKNSNAMYRTQIAVQSEDIENLILKN